MNSNKSIFLRLLSMIAVIAVFALFVTSAEAVTFSTSGDCKDVVNDGIPFTAAVSIPPAQTEIWRDRIQIVILDPNGNNYITPGTDNVKEVVLYATSSGGTAYQCQQLTTDAIDNSFSCNSFPTGATISRMSVRFIPNFDGGGAMVLGDYKISVLNLNTTLEIFSGTAPVSAASTACAWNQTTSPFTPKNPPTPAFTYNTNAACGGGGNQTFQFNENAAAPFTVVSFPLGEAVVKERWEIVASPQVNEYGYVLILNFDGDGDGVADAPYNITYTYTAGTNPADTAVNPTVAGAGWDGTATPVKLIEGRIQIIPGATPMANMPTSTPFSFNIYYRNVDPTLGYENSTFHFTRDMTMLFGPVCAASPVYITTTPIDPCLASKQTFLLPLAAPLNAIPANFNGYYQAGRTFSTADLRHVYFYVQKCGNADCSVNVGTDAYVYRVNLKDPESDTRYYHYAGLWDSTITDIHMKFFKAVGDMTLKSLEFTAKTPGTYHIRGFYKSVDAAAGFPNSGHGLELFVTVPQKDGDTTCLSSGQDGAYQAQWDGCKENHDPQKLEFKAIKERYGFISNYSNQRLVFNFSPAISTIPMAGEITELYCDWQVLADGYSASGAVCNPDRIELPPMTRAIVKGGKISLSQRPPMKDGPNEFEYIMAYQRTTNKDNMNLFIDVQYVECPREAIPDTGYSLRSPAPLAQADGSFIFTGNSLQIPAIGLGMDGGVPIVHLNYKDGTLESGWNLKMLGGYIGELEGGAYLPYAGNSVLTGHYYSQGVFVNLTNLKLEDEIIIFGTDGMKYTYAVTNSYWTEPNNVYQLFQPNGERSLTLVTCDDYNFISDEYQKRYIVQATIVNTEPYQP